MTGQEEMPSSCAQGRFSLDVGKILFVEAVVKCWNRLSRELVESIHLELFKTQVDVTFRDMVSW